MGEYGKLQHEDGTGPLQAKIDRLERELAAKDRQIGAVRELIDRLRHWHDAMRDNSGMVVSRDSVVALWEWRDTALAPEAKIPGEKIEDTLSPGDTLHGGTVLAVVQIKAHQLDAKSVEVLEMTGIKTRNYPVTAIIVTSGGGGGE